jgi:hypothetical protein
MRQRLLLVKFLDYEENRRLSVRANKSGMTESSLKFDVYVSYANSDDDRSPSEPWVGRFVLDLTARLHMMMGRSPEIWMDKLRVERIDNGIKNALTSSALFLALLSPSFLTSRLCMKELGSFVDAAGPSRVVKVVKFPARDRFPLSADPALYAIGRLPAALEWQDRVEVATPLSADGST